MIVNRIKTVGLGFKGACGDKEEHDCTIMVLPAVKQISYDRSVLCCFLSHDPDHTMYVIMPVAIAQRFCDMANGEYLNRDYMDFDEINSVHYWMLISWVHIEPNKDSAYHNFGFGQSADGRFVIDMLLSPKRYTPGSEEPIHRSLTFLSESDLNNVVDAIRDVLAWLNSEEGRQHYDS